MSRIAVMQPYFFPYFGYFQLIRSTDAFVFYDDVNFIVRGRVNRNQILINGKPAWLTVPCRNVSQNRLIMDTRHAMDNTDRDRLLRMVSIAYAKAPYFQDVFPLFERVIRHPSDLMGDLAMESVRSVCTYLEMQVSFRLSSVDYPDTRGQDKAQRLLRICHAEGAGTYVNLPGGRSLYREDEFRAAGISLRFLEPSLLEYTQTGGQFVPDLSVLDLLMFNSKGEVMHLLGQYTLS